MSVTTPQHHRVGAHRARRNPVAVTAFAACSVVALSALLVWGLLATDLIGGSSSGEALGSPTGGAIVDEGAGTVEQPGASASVEVPTSAAEVVPTTPPPSSTPEAPAVDQAVTITVLNGGVTVAGVAKGYAQSLVDAGWSGVDLAATKNAPGEYPNVATTLVAYADPTLQPTAEAIVAALGGKGTATLTSNYASAGFVTQIVVVVGKDLTPA